MTLLKSHHYLKALRGEKSKVKAPGQEVHEMACPSCHQPDQKGLPGRYLSMVDNEWINGDEEALIKVILHELTGPIKVAKLRKEHVSRSRSWTAEELGK